MKRLVLAVSVATLLTLALAAPTWAGADDAASCIGLGSSGSGPLQARDDIALEVKENFADFGASSPGGVYSFFAKLHAGSVEECFPEAPPPPPHP